MSADKHPRKSESECEDGREQAQKEKETCDWGGGKEFPNRILKSHDAILFNMSNSAAGISFPNSIAQRKKHYTSELKRFDVGGEGARASKFRVNLFIISS